MFVGMKLESAWGTDGESQFCNPVHACLMPSSACKQVCFVLVLCQVLQRYSSPAASFCIFKTLSLLQRKNG